MHKELLIFIPTYNEKENIEKLYHEIRRHTDGDILFCDDNSPDGTGHLLDTIAAQDSRVCVLHRAQKLGLGTAHLQAFAYARTHQYTYLLTMDADFTHHPAYIPALLEKREHADVVIGSRYVAGGNMVKWGAVRLQFTYLWRNLIKYGLGMPYDCTGAFRVYTVAKLDPALYHSLHSQGFSFCIESLFYMHYAGHAIVEVPICAQNRMYGQSKLSGSIMKEGALTFLRLLWKKKHKKR
ncbi:MAG: polyprenol monophosphomannose synthase [Candidatus Babeliales bacterium]